jgi:glycosyltransferase involved in cell wall biosynthesis
MLYVTPIMPQRSGGGLAMRAGLVLEALARRFDVQLCVVPVAGPQEQPSDFVLRHAARVHSLDLERNLDPYFALIDRIKDPEERRRAALRYPKPFLSRYCTGESAQTLSEWVGEDPLAAVHIMRLYLAPFVEPFLRRQPPGRPVCVLDLDDDEIQTRQRFARLHHERGDRQAAEEESAELEKYVGFAARYLSAFDRVTLSSATDAIRLGRQFTDARFAAVPNGYRMPMPKPHRASSSGGALRLLFVGTLDYFPNADAAWFLCQDVRDALHRLSDQPTAIDIVGASDGQLARHWRAASDIRVHGFVHDLAPLYAAADVAIIPLRAAGGTRIKILEAFAHRAPVVSTSIGAEGIDVVDGVHILIGDNADQLARACIRIKETPTLGDSLTEQAADLLVKSHSPSCVDAAIGAIYD